MTKTLCIGVALALGLAAAVNGLFMLALPEAWYFAVPGVTDTGPFNQHFVRDIGLIFLFIGPAFLIGAASPRYRIVLWAAADRLALGTRPLPFLGGRGRHLRTVGARAGFSRRHPSGPHRHGFDVLGNRRRPRRRQCQRIVPARAQSLTGDKECARRSRRTSPSNL